MKDWKTWQKAAIGCGLGITVPIALAAGCLMIYAIAIPPGQPTPVAAAPGPIVLPTEIPPTDVPPTDVPPTPTMIPPTPTPVPPTPTLQPIVKGIDFDPGPGWSRSPADDMDLGGGSARAWVHGDDADVIFLVGDRQISYLMPVDGDPEITGGAMMVTALAYGVPLDVLTETAERMQRVDLSPKLHDDWWVNLSATDSLDALIVIFAYMGAQ